MAKKRAKKAVRSKSKTRRPSSSRPARRTGPTQSARRSKAAKRSRPARASVSPRKRPVTKAKAKPKRAPAARPAAATVPSAIGVRNHHMDYTSHAMDDVKKFYTELLGFADFEYDSGSQYLYVRTGASSSMGFMPPMPGPPEQWRPPREPAIYLEVRDVDRAHRELSARGVSFMQPPTDTPWKHRVAILRDPEGRTIMLAQPIAP